MNTQYLKNFVITAFLATTTLFSPVGATAPTDIFLKIDGINGESLDVKYPNDIVVRAWSWGESSGTASTRKGSVPKSCIHDISITKNLDSSSPQLIMDTVSGKVIPTATLTMRKAGSMEFEYLVMKMTNVIISSYATGEADGGDQIKETITLHFDSMEGNYKKQNPDGTAGQAVIWDVSNLDSRGCK